jgi:hypothetical protein
MNDAPTLAEHIAGLREDLAAFRAETHRAIGAITEVMVIQSQLDAYALRSELDDLRLEVRDAVATPFDQE